MLLLRRSFILSLVFVTMTMYRLYESTSVRCADKEMCCSSVPQPRVYWLADMQRHADAGRKSLIIKAPQFLPENSFLAVRNITVSKHIAMLQNIHSCIATTHRTKRHKGNVFFFFDLSKRSMAGGNIWSGEKHIVDDYAQSSPKCIYLLAECKYVYQMHWKIGVCLHNIVSPLWIWQLTTCFFLSHEVYFVESV